MQPTSNTPRFAPAVDVIRTEKGEVQLKADPNNTAKGNTESIPKSVEAYTARLQKDLGDLSKVEVKEKKALKGNEQALAKARAYSKGLDKQVSDMVDSDKRPTPALRAQQSKAWGNLSKAETQVELQKTKYESAHSRASIAQKRVEEFDLAVSAAKHNKPAELRTANQQLDSYENRMASPNF